MSIGNLYGVELAKVFDTMYQGFIDYEEEFEFYATKAKALSAQSIIELGCGTGNLAKYFTEYFKPYLGLDLSEHMLQLAREKNPKTHFMQADMRSFITGDQFDLALITGRSSSYLLSHTDLLNTFESISKTLKSKGHLIFDCIDAERFVPYVDKNPRVTHHSKVGSTKFRRLSHWQIENRQENLVNWKADYYRIEGTKEVLLGQDRVIFKAFTRKEISELLEKEKYRVLSVEDRSSYAFDTFVVHAEKNPTITPQDA